MPTTLKMTYMTVEEYQRQVSWTFVVSSQFG